MRVAPAEPMKDSRTAPHMNFQELPISKLITLKAPFSFTYGPPPEILRKSIQEIGVTHPPILLEKDSNLILITGRRRIAVLNQINPTSHLLAKIYSSNEISDLDAFRINLFENLSTRNLNPIEKANTLHTLTHTFKLASNEIFRDYLPLLNIPTKGEWLSLYLKLLELNTRAQDLVSQGALQADSAVELLKFNTPDQCILLKLITELRLGINSQKSLLKLSWETIRKAHTTLAALLEEKAFQKIFKMDDAPPSQKWTQLEAELKRHRYPILSRLESQFNQIKKKLKLPPTLTLQNPPYFETNDYLIQLRFKNLQEYTNHLRLLESMAKQKALEELFKLTGENDQTLHA